MLNTENLSINDIPSFLDTDLYNIRICERNYKQHFSKKEVHEVFYRRNPYKGTPFVVAVGIPYALRYLKSRLENEYAEWLVAQGYSADFVEDILTNKSFFSSVNIWSVDEGTIVMPNEPIMRVEGDSNALQMLETYLLNQIGFPTLIATKALRCSWAARQFKNPAVLSEYGLRRAQASAGHVGSRSAYIGGFAMTSNALAGRIFDIPVSGSGMMHADIQRRETEEEAFRSFYDYVPLKDKIVFLIDTYDVLNGAKNALKIASEMRLNGHELLGVRIDSGDPEILIPKVRKIFADANFPDIKILLSGDMNEHKILALAKAEIQVEMIGVGTELITGGDKSALGIVYKLKGLMEGDSIIPKIKISADPSKTTLPGAHQVWRFYDSNGQIKNDIISLTDEKFDDGEPLLKQIVLNGKIVDDLDVSDAELTNRARVRAFKQFELLPEKVISFESDDKIDVRLSERAQKIQQDLVQSD